MSCCCTRIGLLCQVLIGQPPPSSAVLNLLGLFIIILPGDINYTPIIYSIHLGKVSKTSFCFPIYRCAFSFDQNYCSLLSFIHSFICTPMSISFLMNAADIHDALSYICMYMHVYTHYIYFVSPPPFSETLSFPWGKRIGSKMTAAGAERHFTHFFFFLLLFFFLLFPSSFFSYSSSFT